MQHPENSEITQLLLIRHGATEANERRPYVLQGNTMNGSLSETGRRQAAAVGEFLACQTIHHVYSSPMQRAIETARQIAGHHQLDVKTVPTISEVHVGEWEGLDWDTIMQRHPESYREFIANPADIAYQGGESYADVLRRVQPALDRLLEEHIGETIVVVAHNVVNRAYLAGLLGIELSRAKDIRQMNTGVNVIRRQDGETRLITLNAAFHLWEM